MVAHSDQLLIQYARLSELPRLAVEQDWLSPPEQDECGRRWRAADRRQMWLAGRWIAKQLIRQNVIGLSTRASDISIQSIDEQGRAARPRVRVGDHSQTEWCLSITHSARGVLVALATAHDTRVGIDLCERRPYPPGFTSTWFTRQEQKRLDPGQQELIGRTWAAKESIYKACNHGEPFAPRRIEVSWDAGSTRCRYGDYVFGNELVLETWTVDNHIAVSAVVTGLEESAICPRNDTFLRKCPS